MLIKNYDKLANLDNVDIIDGFGSFIDKNTVSRNKRWRY